MRQKGFAPVLILIIVAVLGIGGYFYFNYSKALPANRQNGLSDKQYTPPAPIPSSTPTVDTTIKFDVEKAKVGDKIGNMTITKLGSRKSEKPTADSAIVEFKGKETVTGQIRYYEPGGFMGETVCMENLDEKSLAKMPKMISDTRDLWFCFNDLEAAKKSLSKSKQATVVIDNYSIIYYPSEVYNTADFVSVIQ